MKLIIALTLYISSSKANSISPIIEHYAHRNKLDAFLVAAVIYKESRFYNKACFKGAHGLMQVQLKNRSCNKQALLRATNLYKPRYNIRRGTALMSWAKKYCKKRGHKSHHWLMHYNMGKRVHGNKYAEDVLKIYQKLKRHSKRDEI